MKKNNLLKDKQYSTSQVAKIIGIHPNTVRMYEEWEFITKPNRKQNGYRIFTDLHIAQFKIARLAFHVEIVHNGLRKQATEIVRTCALCDFKKALSLTSTYMENIKSEQRNAEKAIEITEQILFGKYEIKTCLYLTRKEAAELLSVTIDTLRNWELNGLITIKREKNGYRVYSDKEINMLRIIKSLRNANYSLSAILRMLTAIFYNPKTNIRQAINTSQPDDDIITACDTLLTSLYNANQNAEQIYELLSELISENL